MTVPEQPRNDAEITRLLHWMEEPRTYDKEIAGTGRQVVSRLVEAAEQAQRDHAEIQDLYESLAIVAGNSIERAELAESRMNAGIRPFSSTLRAWQEMDDAIKRAEAAEVRVAEVEAELDKATTSDRNTRADATKLMLLFEGFLYGDPTVGESAVVKQIHNWMTKQPVDAFPENLPSYFERWKLAESRLEQAQREPIRIPGDAFPAVRAVIRLNRGFVAVSRALVSGMLDAEDLDSAISELDLAESRLRAAEQERDEAADLKFTAEEVARDLIRERDEALAEITALQNAIADVGESLDTARSDYAISAARLRTAETALRQAQAGIITPPYCQVIGGNAVVLLTPEQIDRIIWQFESISGKDDANWIVSEMRMAKLRLDEAVSA